MTLHTITKLLLALGLGGAPLVAVGASRVAADTQERTVPATDQNDPETSSKVLLSQEDESFLHASFFISGVYTGGEQVPPGSSPLQRVVSLACYVTVQEAWEPTLYHGFDAVSATGTAEIPVWASYKRGTMNRSFAILCVPRVGLTWGQVTDVNDVRFIVSDTTRR